MKTRQITEAIILAGGFGTRLQHIVSDVPKPMAPINGIPFLSFLLKKLIAANISHVTLSTGFLHDKIETFYGNRFESLQISYSREDQPLWTGGAIKLALEKVRSDDVLVLNGDTLFDIDFQSFMKFHFSKKTELAVALREVEDVGRYGSVSLNENSKISSFAEKNKVTGKGLINGGIYSINKTLFSDFVLNEKFSFEKELLEKCYGQRDFYGMVFNSYFIDIGIPEDYFKAQVEFPHLKF